MQDKNKGSVVVKKKRGSRTTPTWKYLVVLVPILIFWFCLHMYPNIAIVFRSFYSWNSLSNVSKWVGLRNFRIIFSSEQWFQRLFFNTTAYMLYNLILQTVLSLLLALVLRKSTRRNNALRTLYFIPMVLSSVAISLIWTYIYDSNVGLLHSLFGALGLENLAGFRYLSGRFQWLFFIAIVQIWAGIGIPITLFTAAFQSIPEEIYEASALDGANGWQTFWGVTFPQLMPTILRVMMLTLSGAAMAFDYVLMLGVQNSEAGATFDTWSVAIYKTINSNDYGMVAANSTILAIFLMIICIIQYIVTRRAEDSFL